MIAEYTVGELVGQVKRMLEGEFRAVTVTGEVTNLRPAGSGHWYFTLTDGDSSLSIALFRGDAMRNPIIKKIKDGDQITCLGSIGVYAKRGSFQLIAKQITTTNKKGDLLAEFEKLKSKLAKEGLFENKYKKEIPTIPRKIALITASGSAALADFLNVFDRRSNFMDVLLVPALVQGDGSPRSLRMALKKAIKYHVSKSPLDLIVFTRGGGSLEDLWAFNDEQLVRDIFECDVPIISAVGHQIDFTLCDFVADLRMETPTAAAEIITKNQIDLDEKLERALENLLSVIDDKAEYANNSLNNCHPKNMLEKIWRGHHQNRENLSKLGLPHRAESLLRMFDFQMRLDDGYKSLKEIPSRHYQKLFDRNEQASKLLATLGPLKVLGRGYSYVKSQKGDVLSSAATYNKLPKDEKFSIVFADGKGSAMKAD